MAADTKGSAKLAPEASPKLAKRYRGDVENVMRKKYQQHFAWGQLVSWFKQTIYDPSASLSADRRGTMSLPDPESAYGGSKPGTYERSERKALLAHLDKNPDRSWPTTWRWSFRNPAKVSARRSSTTRSESQSRGRTTRRRRSCGRCGRCEMRRKGRRKLCG